MSAVLRAAMTEREKTSGAELQTLIESRGTCAVCLEIARDHRSLPCQHIFCLECLEPLVCEHILVCPTCKDENYLEEGVAVLPRNLLLKDMLERFCVKCLERSRQIRCEHCLKWLCKDCHEPCRRSIKANKEKLLTETKELLTTANKKIELLKSEQEQLTLRISSISSQIDKRADRLVEEIRARQKQLHAQVNLEGNRESARIRGLLTSTTSEKDELQAYYGSNIEDADWKLYNQVVSMCVKWDVRLEGESFSSPVSRNTIEYVPDEGVPMEQRCALGVITKKSLDDKGVICEVGPSFKPLRRRTVNYLSGALSFDVYACIGAKSTEAFSPSHLATCPVTNHVIVIDSENNQIQVLDTKGQFLYKFGHKGRSKGQLDLGLFSSVAVTSRGHVVVSDTNNSRIQIFAEKGKFLKEVGSLGKRPGQFRLPLGVCYNGDHLYVCDCGNSRIQVLGEGGEVIQIVDTRGMEPVNVAVCQSGDLLVIGYFPGRDNACELCVYSDNGRRIDRLGTGKPGTVMLKEPRGLTVDKHGYVLVTDAGTHLVHVLEPTGQLIRTFGSPGHKSGELDQPVGVTCTQDGAVVIGDWRNQRVQMFKFK